MFAGSLRKRRAFALATLSTIAVTAAGVLTPVTVTRGGPDGSLTVRLSLIDAAMAQSIGTVGLNDVVLDFGMVKVRLPRAELEGATLGQSDLLALLDSKSSAPLAPRLAQLSAKRIAIPEIVIEQSLAGERQTTRYRNLVATDVVSGRVGSIAVEATGFEIAGKTKASGTLGRMTVADLDLAEMARVYSERGGEQPGALRRVYGAFAAENFAMSYDKGVEMRMARLAGRDFQARPLKDSWTETVKTLGSMQNVEKPSEADQQKLFAIVADMLGAFQIGSAEINGVEIRDPKGKEKVEGRIARIAYTGGAQGEARVDGMEVATNDGRARVNTIAFTGFSWDGAADGFRSLSTRPVASLDAADLRKLVPTIGTVRFSGLDFDVPNESAKEEKPRPGAPAAQPQRIRFALNAMELTADKPLNGIPTNLRFALDNLSFAVPASAKESGLKELSRLGYSKADLSFATAASWNEPGSELVIREVSLRGAEMGIVTIRGVLGNVSKDVFNPDSALAMVALVGATARNAEITVENQGLFERVVAQEAKKQKKSPENLRREYGMGAAIAIPAILGNSASAKSLGQAVARFVAKPGRLVVNARAKDSAGLGVADLAGLSDPSAVLEKLDVTATAE